MHTQAVPWAVANSALRRGVHLPSLNAARGHISGPEVTPKTQSLWMASQMAPTAAHTGTAMALPLCLSGNKSNRGTGGTQ